MTKAIARTFLAPQPYILLNPKSQIPNPKSQNFPPLALVLQHNLSQQIKLWHTVVQHLVVKFLKVKSLHLPAFRNPLAALRFLIYRWYKTNNQDQRCRAGLPAWMVCRPGTSCP